MATDSPSADLLVIGGGIIGTTTALAAAAGGADVVVIDAGGPAGSTANAGSLHVQMQSRILRLFPELAPNIEASLPLYVQAVREWERLDQAHGGFELGRDGGLMVAETDAELQFLAVKADRERRQGLDVAILERTELEAIAPYLGPQVVGAELCHHEGKVNPLLANARLRAAAKAHGVRFVNDRVEAIATDQGGVLATGRLPYRAERAVIAAAFGARPLCAALGAPVPATFEPLHMNITEPAAYGLRHLIQHAERPITLKQFQSGQIVIGGGWPARHDGGAPAPEVLASSLLGNVALAARLAPAIAGLRIVRSWAGLNTTVDGKCVLGWSPASSRVLFALPGDAGYTLGPLVGRAAAALALGADPPFDPTPFSPNRFT